VYGFTPLEIPSGEFVTSISNGVYARNWDEGIVFGVARSVKPRSNSASAGAKPGGIEAPVTIPSSLGR